MFLREDFQGPIWIKYIGNKIKYNICILMTKQFLANLLFMQYI